MLVVALYCTAKLVYFWPADRCFLPSLCLKRRFYFYDALPIVSVAVDSTIAGRRYGCVFTGHNGAQSYYSGRGFRGWLRV